jgi:hypothetical protein
VLKDNLFKEKNYSLYSYNDIVKKSNDIKYPEYIKLSFDKDKKGEFKTKLFLKKLDNKLEQIDIIKIDDVCDVLKHNCECRFIIQAKKMWFSKNKDSISKKYSYGMKLTVLQIEVKEMEPVEEQEYTFSDSE